MMPTRVSAAEQKRREQRYWNAYSYHMSEGVPATVAAREHGIVYSTFRGWMERNSLRSKWRQAGNPHPGHVRKATPINRPLPKGIYAVPAEEWARRLRERVHPAKLRAYAASVLFGILTRVPGKTGAMAPLDPLIDAYDANHTYTLEECWEALRAIGIKNPEQQAPRRKGIVYAPSSKGVLLNVDGFRRVGGTAV